ncbi:MAG: transglutaminase domain-containing protein [Spirochaetaceae bacterium]
MANRVSRPRDVLLPVGLFLLTVLALLLLLYFSNPSPRISEISPPRARPGERILIRGDDFGEERGQSRVELAGQVPTSSRYIAWSDGEIELDVPTGARSGLLYVVTPGGRSNPVLFTNSESEPTARGELRIGPAIESLNPVTVTEGEALTILGTGFGRRRGDSRVLFTPLDGEEPNLEVDALSGGYLSWSEEAITVRVPSGAGSGPVQLVTRRGNAGSELLNLDRPSGTASYENPREWAVRQEVTLHRFAGERSGEIRLWLPEPQWSPAQRGIQLLNESEQGAVRLYRQATLYELTPPPPAVSEEGEETETPEELRVIRTFLFRRYEVTAEVDPDAVPTEYSVDEAFLRRYRRPEPRLRMGEEPVRSFATESVRGVTNRYEQASWIYREALRLLEPDPSGPSDPVEALESGTASSAGYAALMVAALREVGVPAREVSGVLFLDDVRSVRHGWVEFFLQDFGWFPADPALGDGLFLDALPPSPEDTARDELYFGRLDNRRGAFSHGEIPTPSTELSEESRVPEEPYSLQLLYEEASPAVGEYESEWPVPELIGSY